MEKRNEEKNWLSWPFVRFNAKQGCFAKVDCVTQEFDHVAPLVKSRVFHAFARPLNNAATLPQGVSEYTSKTEINEMKG